MKQSEHTHEFVLVEEFVEGPECCFGPAPCIHCGNCITGSGNHSFDPSEPDGAWIQRYICSTCGMTKEVRL